MLRGPWSGVETLKTKLPINSLAESGNLTKSDDKSDFCVIFPDPRAKTKCTTRFGIEKDVFSACHGNLLKVCTKCWDR